MARLEISSINPTGRWDRIDQNFVELYAFMDHMEAAWTTAAATVTADVGTYTSATGNMRYKQVGKTVHIQLQAAITTVGPGVGAVRIQVPFAASAAQSFAVHGANLANNGELRCLVPNAGTEALVQLTHPSTGSQLDVAQDGTIITAGGTYETI